MTKSELIKNAEEALSEKLFHRFSVDLTPDQRDKIIPEIKSFLRTQLSSAIDSTLEAVRIDKLSEEGSPNDDAVGSEQRAFGWNRAAEEQSNRIQEFKK